MRLSSEKAFTAGLERWEGMLAERPGQEIALARELAQVAQLLRNSVTLLSAVQDYSRSADARAALIAAVLDGKVTGEVSDLVSGLVRDTWSDLADLPDSLDTLVTHTLLIGARRDNRLKETQSQLFDFLQILRGQRDLRVALSERKFTEDRRLALMRKVIGSANRYVTEIIENSVRATERVSLVSSVRSAVDLAAQREQRLVAAVLSVIPLTTEQEQRLAHILERKYGKKVQIYVSIDPTIAGGIRVSIGDDVIDGTLATRINSAREAIKN